MTAKRNVKNVESDGRVFKDDKQALLTIALIALVALVAFNFENITGGAITEPSSLSVFQDGKKIIVQVNYPAGKYGKPNNIVDMRTTPGTKSADATTECDSNMGYASKGTSKCMREIAEFDIRGATWKSGETVTFSVRGTNVKKDYTIR